MKVLRVIKEFLGLVFKVLWYMVLLFVMVVVVYEFVFNYKGISDYVMGISSGLQNVNVKK